MEFTELQNKIYNDLQFDVKREILRYQFIENYKNISYLFENNMYTNRDVIIPDKQEFNDILDKLNNIDEININNDFINEFQKRVKIKLLKYFKKANIKRKFDLNNSKIFWCLARSMQLDLLSPISWSLPKHIKLEFRKHFGTNYELFGLFFNSTLEYHNTIFPDLELNGGKINFYNWKPIKGSYYGSPPYSSEIMTVLFERILEWLEMGNKLQFILMLPIWDKKSREKLKLKPYPDFPPQAKIIESQFNKYLRLFKGEKIKLYDYLRDSYIKPGDTSIIILQNYNFGESDKKFMDSLLESILI